MDIQTIELKQFVHKTLEDVVSAIDEYNDGQRTHPREFYLDNISSKGVHFDLAITVTGTTGKEGQAKFGIKVLELGGGATKTTSTESTNRIQFNVQYRHR